MFKLFGLFFFHCKINLVNYFNNYLLILLMKITKKNSFISYVAQEIQNNK